MNLRFARIPLTSAAATPSRADRLLPRLIVASGVLCFLLLAWGHLGLGAWLFPPAPTVARQTAQAGPYQVELSLNSGQLTVRRPNTLALHLQDQRGHAITGASVRVLPQMTTMPMTTPAVGATAQAAGQYLARPVFSMAGDWRLKVTIALPGQLPTQTTFSVTVRWN